MSSATFLQPDAEMRLANLVRHLQVARRVRPAPAYLWRELVVRRPRLAQYRLRETSQTIHLRHRTQDLTGFAEVFVRGNYDPPPRIASVMDRVAPPLRAVDLGANIGLFGVKLLAQRPDADIVAVEPDPLNLEVLRATVASSGSDSWHVIEACAATEDGSVRFRAGRFLESRIADDGDPFPAVDVFPVLASADFIKMDIEGAEHAILADPRFRTLRAAVVCLEYHVPHTREDVVGLLSAAGYTVEPFEERMPGYGELWAWKT